MRTNTGGVQLNTADLLMSFSSAYWKNLDARKEMEEIITTVQNYGFSIDKNFILRTAYYILGRGELNTNKLDKESIREIEANWFEIKRAILDCFNYLKELGFFHSAFSYSATALPLILFIYKRKTTPKNNEDVYKWLWLALLKRYFGYKSCQTRLNSCRKVIDPSPVENQSKENKTSQTDTENESDKHKYKNDEFPYSQIIAEMNKNNADLQLKESDIDRYLTARYNSSDALCILQILYFYNHGQNKETNLPFNKNLHQDHIHPQARFNTKLAKNNENYKKEIWDSVLNLQLLAGPDNQSKSDKTLKEWLNEKIAKSNGSEPEEQIKTNFYKDLYISDLKTELDREDALEIGNGIDELGFVKFIEARRKGLKDALIQYLIKEKSINQ